MNVLRNIVAYCMKVWIEDRAARRKKRDVEIIHDFFDDFAKSSYGAAQWERVPQRLKWRIQHEIHGWIWERARWGWQDVPRYIEHARACGIEIAPDDVRAMYAMIMTNDIVNIETRLQYARLLHGTPLPLDAVLDMLRTQGEWRMLGCLYQPGCIRALLAEIDHDDALAVECILQTIAVQGHFQQLQEAYKVLKQPIDVDWLRVCFDAHLQQKQWYAHDVATMCIWLKDWEKGEELIRTWKNGNNHEQAFAAQIALAMFQNGYRQQAYDP